MEAKTMKQHSDTPLYSIGTAARILGISVHTMRLYERSGLIVPYKSTSNQRRYSDGDIERLRCIRAAIHDEKMSIEGIRRVLSLIPCWAILHCTDDDRENCPAYNGHSEPCWSLRKKATFCGERDCRACVVYTDYGNCHSIKEKLKTLLQSS